MKKFHSIHTISGEATAAERPVFFSFHPDFPEQGRFNRYRKYGTAILTSDGTFEFLERSNAGSRAKIIKKLLHGRLTRTTRGEFLLTIRIKEFEDRPMAIICDNAMAAMDALHNYLHKEDAA